MEHTLGVFDSWTVESKTVITKNCDKSFFDYKGSGIPIKIRWFFEAENMNKGDRKDIIITYEGKTYNGYVSRSKNETGVTRIFWDKDLALKLEKFNKDEMSFPKARFERIEDNHYHVTIDDSKVMPYKEVTEWVISGNPKYYDMNGAFRELGSIDWKQSTNVTEGDLVYIYISGTIQSIYLKCRANKVNKEYPTIDDSKFDKENNNIDSKGRYMELELMEELSGTAFSRPMLEKHGFSSPQSPVRVPKQVKEYLDLIQKLQHTDEMDADSHDGSYKLIREIIQAYAKKKDLSDCDYKDLNLIYLSCVGTWRHGIDAKRKTILESRLPENEKNNINYLLTDIWERSQKGQYSNQENKQMSLGMFGTGFFTFLGKTDEASPRNFIQMCIDIINMNDEEEIYDCCERTLNEKLRGMGVASASMILHCLKPYVFPIFNGNMGSDNIYEYFGIPLHQKDEVYTYISNCREVKKFRDANFSVKNYRIFDIVAQNLRSPMRMTSIDYLGVLDYLDHNRKVPYSDPNSDELSSTEKKKYLKIKQKGQNANNEIKEMVKICKEKFGLDKCEPMSWLDGSNKKTRDYLWAQMKYNKYEQNPISISLFAEISPITNRPRYRFSLEIKNDKADKLQMAQYHSYLDIPLQSGSALKYVVGSNEYSKLNVVNESVEQIKENLNKGIYKKVQLSRILEWTDQLTNSECEIVMIDSIKELLPYYEHVVGASSSNIEQNDLSSSDDYDPKISIEEYESILSNKTLVEHNWLDTLYYIYQLGGKASYKQVVSQYGKEVSHYNSHAVKTARTVYKETNSQINLRETDDTEYLPVLFDGKDIAEDKDGSCFYKIRKPLMEAIQNLEKRGVFQDMKETKRYDKNMILYGPPGTGKTYCSAIYAVAICDGKSIEELSDYDEVMKRYDELKSEHRVVFTTFHQSFGYEEFIEGIKPKVDEESSDVAYTIEPGIFKKFCEDARKPENIKIDHNAQIWFVRLNGIRENDLKTECFKEGCIRFNYRKNEESSDYMKWLRQMNVGDYVVSYYDGSKKIDAIGVIDDSEPFYDESKYSYQWTRKVIWLVKNICVDVKAINGDTWLPNFEIAKLKRMKISDLLQVVTDQGGYAGVKNQKPYVFIIDEINRGNISKIFGELITLIEDTKREGMPEQTSAILPYSQEKFSVPKNVYILGTMNTADRSIALMDTALRRRFHFIEMMPDADILRSIHADKVGDLDIAAILEKINERITFLYDREHTIGHAFFTCLQGEKASLENLQTIFEKSVIPLLQEYFYEDYQKIQLVLGDNSKSSSEFQFIRDEKVVVKNIFKGNVEDDIDLPEKKYSVNKSAFAKVESYKEIL